METILVTGGSGVIGSPANIRLVEFHLFTGELFHTTKALFAGIGKIIHDDDAVPLVEKFQYG